MTDPSNEKPVWVHRAAEQLRELEETLTPMEQERLYAARRAAMRRLHAKNKPPRTWTPVAGLGTVAASTLLAVLLVTTAQTPLPRLNDQELAAAQEVEMLEALEFAAWMVAMEDAGELPNQG